MKVLIVFGTRPEAIKLAPVIRELERRPGIVLKTCVTAQHRDMLDQVLEVFEIVPDYDLDLMRSAHTLPLSAAGILSKLAPILESEQPDWALVQGDTTTAAISSLCAFYAKAKVGHIEAGLRSHDKWQPFPEEVHRRIAGCIADLHFAPTEGARRNLLQENIPGDRILVTGNTGIDALRYARASLQGSADLDRAGIRLRSDARIILVTAHRRENFGQPLSDVCAAIRRLAVDYGDSIQIVFPVHPNPNVRGVVHSALAALRNVTLCDPLTYLPLVELLSRSYLVLTDSGGIQEEAPGLGVPVLCLRAVTERPEGVAAGCVRLVGTDPEVIYREAALLLDNATEHQAMSRVANPYGDGFASSRIVSAIQGEQVTEFKPEGRDA